MRVTASADLDVNFNPLGSSNQYGKELSCLLVADIRPEFPSRKNLAKLNQGRTRDENSASIQRKVECAPRYRILHQRRTDQYIGVKDEAQITILSLGFPGFRE